MPFPKFPWYDFFTGRLTTKLAGPWRRQSRCARQFRRQSSGEKRRHGPCTACPCRFGMKSMSYERFKLWKKTKVTIHPSPLPSCLTSQVLSSGSTWNHLRLTRRYTKLLTYLYTSKFKYTVCQTRTVLSVLSVCTKNFGAFVGCSLQGAASLPDPRPGPGVLSLDSTGGCASILPL